MHRIDILFSGMLNKAREPSQKAWNAKAKYDPDDDADMRESFRGRHAGC